MKCPKCGYMRQARDDAFVPVSECPSCGIVYSKHDTIAAPADPTLAAAAPHLRPSAVDPASLKKARERVEKRLRERMASRTRDNRYEQTLELAKKITSNINNGQDADSKKSKEKTGSTPTRRTAEAAVQTEEAVLLDEMVGVRLHDGNDAKAPKGGDGATATVSPSPDNASAEASADRDAVEAEAPAPEKEQAEAAAPEADVADAIAHAATGETAATQTMSGENSPQKEGYYPEDVQVETVVLTSHVETNGPMSAPDLGLEPPASEAAMEDESVDLPDAYIAEASNATRFGANLTRLLPMVAWFILVAGLVGAVLSWTTIGEVQAGVNTTAPPQPGSALPLGLLLGFAYLATGALGFAFFWVSSMINRQLKDIRQILMIHPNVSDAEALAAHLSAWTDPVDKR